MATTGIDERARASEALTWRNPDGSPHSIPLREVTAEVEQVTGYSGHADQRGLLAWLFAEEPSGRRTRAGRTVFITHGEDQSRQALMAAIKVRAAEWQAADAVAVEVVLPTRRDRTRGFDLDAGGWTDDAIGPGPDDRLTALEQRVAALEELVARLAHGSQ